MTSPPTPSSDVRETIRQEWLNAAPAWRKWYSKLSSQSRIATKLVLDGAQLSPGLQVLDLATGSGEPALTVASAVGPQGHVIATDLVEEMLDIARENAASRNLTNMEFRAADAEQLPFSDHTFDRITCRFGIMFIPDIPRALAEMRRVLKPGGRVSFITWGPLTGNPLFSTMIGPFTKYVQVPPPPPDAPHIFRFADEHKLAQILSAAGFHEVRAAKHKVDWPWPGPPEEAWVCTSELAAPFKKIMAAVPPEKKQEVIHEVIEGMRHFYDGHSVNFHASLVAATATTPA
jgi:SAM-dependent methyltransferase